MKENNVKGESVQATGKGGRITKGDVVDVLQKVMYYSRCKHRLRHKRHRRYVSNAEKR